MFAKALADALRKRCTEKGWSYEIAAERCDISARYFGSIVRMRACPSMEVLEKICIGFSCTPNDLLLNDYLDDLKNKQTTTETHAEKTRIKIFGLSGKRG